MWPRKVDLNQDECNSMLRQIGKCEVTIPRFPKYFLSRDCFLSSNDFHSTIFTELDCYSNVITAFRAQGGLDDLKTRILADLRKIFHIDADRHKAEARRAANDEELTTIADL